MLKKYLNEFSDSIPENFGDIPQKYEALFTKHEIMFLKQNTMLFYNKELSQITEFQESLIKYLDKIYGIGDTNIAYMIMEYKIGPEFLILMKKLKNNSSAKILTLLVEDESYPITIKEIPNTTSSILIIPNKFYRNFEIGLKTGYSNHKDETPQNYEISSDLKYLSKFILNDNQRPDSQIFNNKKIKLFELKNNGQILVYEDTNKKNHLICSGNHQHKNLENWCYDLNECYYLFKLEMKYLEDFFIIKNNYKDENKEIILFYNFK